MAVRGPPAGVREGSDSNPGAGLPSVGWGWDSGVGGHVVLSLHARVSDHVSGPHCMQLPHGGHLTTRVCWVGLHRR
jgi:hypothetical protein